MYVLFGSVLRTHAHETAHTHITQSLKESVSLLKVTSNFLIESGSTHLDHPPY